MDIYIWGCNDFSARLLSVLQKTPVSVLGFIEDGQPLTSFKGLAVYSPDTFKKHNIKVPIVIAAPHKMIFSMPLMRMKSMQQFKELIQHITNDYQISNELLHPVALLDFVPLEFKNKIILFGMQGSGNVIFTHLFQDLLKIYFPFFLKRDKTTAFFEIMSREYMHITQQVVTDAIHLVGGHEVRSVAWKIGTSHINCKLNQHDCSIYSFATREHLALATPMYHQIPSESYLKKLLAKKFKLFFIMRNPLDIILSSLNKAKHVNQTDKHVDDALFEATALWVIDQLRAWEPQLRYFTVLHYEELIAQPRKTIKKMMRYLRLPPLGFVANRLWHKHGFKQLPNTFNDHFWKGGIGKWEQYFTKNQLLFLQSCGIENSLETYHYADILARFKQAIGDMTQDSVTINDLSERHRCCYGDETMNTAEFLERQHGSHHCTFAGSFILQAHDDETRRKFKGVFENDYIQKIAAAGAHSGFGAERLAI